MNNKVEQLRELFANAPETADCDFTVARFAAGVNKDLADTVGNLVNRTLSFAARNFAGAIPRDGEAGAPEHALAEDLARRIARLRSCHVGLEFRRAAAETRAIFSLANAYLTEQAPWSAAKSDPGRAAAVLRTGLNLIAIGARLAWSIVPDLAADILRQLGIREQIPRWPKCVDVRSLDALPRGSPLGNPGPLVPKIDDAALARLTLRYGGAAAAAADPLTRS